MTLRQAQDIIFPAALLNRVDAAALIVGLIVIILAIALTAWMLWTAER